MQDPFIERIIKYFMPGMAVKRMANRLRFEHMKRHYYGATGGERFSDWVGSMNHPDDDISSSFLSLISRARDLEKNNPWVTRSQQVFANNIVGTGIKPNIQMTSDRDERIVKEIWEEWSEQCDITGVQNFASMQHLIMQSVTLVGGVFAYPVRYRSNKSLIPFKIQLMEQDHLAVSLNKFPNNNGLDIINGIEFDAMGVAKSYHLYKRHPGRLGPDSRSVLNFPKDEILYIFFQKRPGQNIGVTWYHAVMAVLKMLDDFSDATLERQRSSHSITGFVKDTVYDGFDPTKTAQKGNLKDHTVPGGVYNLPSGKDFIFADPPEPHEYGGFTKTVLKSVSTGLNMPYESLSGDLSDVNFSSMRGSWLEFQRNITHWQQNIIIRQFCQPVFNIFRDYLMIRTVVSEEPQVQWIPPRREMIDVVEETKTLIMAMAAGLKPYKEALTELGRDPEATIDEVAKSFDLLKKMGLDFEWLPWVTAAKRESLKGNSMQGAKQNGN